MGLHSTDYLTPYLSLWARVADFEPRTLFDDLNRTRTAVRMRAFRGTVFIVHRKNVPLLMSGLRLFYSSTTTQLERFGRKEGIDLKQAEKIVLPLLAGRKLKTAGELNRAIRLGLGKAFQSGVLPFILRYLEFKGLVVRVGQKHITDHVIPYGLLGDWLPEASRGTPDPDQALASLVRRYILLFGPVCLDDICWWLPVPKTAGRKALDRLKEDLAFFDFDGREYMMDRDDRRRFDRFRPVGDASIINFLPYEDHFPKAYAVRRWFLPEDAEPLLYEKGVTLQGQIRPSIWLDGQIIGRWELTGPLRRGAPAGVRIVGLVRPSRFSKKILAAIDDERQRLERFLNHKLRPLCGAKEES